MKKLNSIIYALLFLMLIIGINCKMDLNEFLKKQFPEVGNLSTDLYIDGEVAAPLLNSSFRLYNFIPQFKDSSLIITIDNNKLIHIEANYKDFFELSAATIFGCPISNPVQPTSYSFRTDTMKIKLFELSVAGHVFFNNPSITIKVKNKIPIVTYFTVDALKFHSSAYTTVYEQPYQKTYINIPTTAEQTALTDIIINRTLLPSLDQTMSPVPDKVFFKITLGNDQVQTYNPAIFPDICDRKITADLKIDMPIDVRIVDWVMADTVPFKLPDTNIQQIDSVKIKLFIDNEIPLGGTFNLYITDTNQQGAANNILLKVLDNWQFKPGITNTQGVSIASQKSAFVYKISQQQLKFLKDNNASKMILSVKLNTYNTQQYQYVKAYSNQKIKIRAGVKISYNGNTNQL